MIKKMILLAASALMLSGCASMFNPYDDGFTCPDYDKGKCVPLEASYKESITGMPAESFMKVPPCYNCNEDELKEHAEKYRKKGYQVDAYVADQKRDTTSELGQPHAKHIPSNELTYRNALMGRLSGMIKQPQTPVVAPPKVMRVLMLPYKTEDNMLNTMRYVYFFADEPKFVLDNYLNLENLGEGDM